MKSEHKRRQNERKFRAWDEVPDGGRRYLYEVEGRDGCLVVIHEKYPVNKGHIRVKEANR